MNRHDYYKLIDQQIPRNARIAIACVLEEEQGYVNHASDRGGETNFGISSRWYPELDIADLSAAQAANIYYQDYWLKNYCHLLPPDIALIIFDAAVNQGGKFARKTLQSLLNVTVDGIIGERTLSAARELSDNDCWLLCVTFTQKRIEHYVNIVQSTPSQAVFLNGWVKRAFCIFKHIRIT